MAFFSQEEEKTRLNEYSIIQYVHKKDSTAREIISYYETTNNSAYQHYASEWRHIDLNMSDEVYKQRIFDSICAAIIDDNATIHDMCKSDLEKLNVQTEDLDFSEIESIEDNIDYEEFQEYGFPLKMVYSDFWPSNAIRLKAYADKTSSFYTNGKLSNFEYFLRNIYRQKLLSNEFNRQLATSGYERDISIYRDTYFENNETALSDSSFYLQVEQQLDNLNYELAEDIIFQATEDASSGTTEINFNFFISFQSYFNSLISNYALQVRESTYGLPSNEVKYLLQSAKLKEAEYINRYSELFNLYVSTFNQIYRKLALLTLIEGIDMKLPLAETYKLNTFFDDVEETFEDALQTSMGDMVNQSVSYYEKTGTDNYILGIENQIRNYYQEQLSKLYLSPVSEISIKDIQKHEIPVLEDYKEKIDEFRNACMRKTSYPFTSDYPPINKYVDYSFNIGNDFQGLDKRTVVEWAMQAAKKEDLSLYSINVIRLKISEFININCINGDTSSHKEIVGSHELSVRREKFAMIENQLLVFGEILIETYMQYFKRYYEDDTKSEVWKEFEKKVLDIKDQPLTTYYDTSFDIASVQDQAEKDNEHYDSGEDAPYYTKMRNVSQQKIFEVNELYAEEIEQVKEDYIKTGRKMPLTLKLNILRVDIDRIVDDYLNLVNYYVKEFNVNDVQVIDEFDKGPYYSFQNKTTKKIQE